LTSVNLSKPLSFKEAVKREFEGAYLLNQTILKKLFSVHLD